MVFEPQTHPNPHSFFLSLSLLLENKQATIKKKHQNGTKQTGKKKRTKEKVQERHIDTETHSHNTEIS